MYFKWMSRTLYIVGRELRLCSDRELRLCKKCPYTLVLLCNMTKIVIYAAFVSKLTHRHKCMNSFNFGCNQAQDQLPLNSASTGIPLFFPSGSWFFFFFFFRFDRWRGGWAKMGATPLESVFLYGSSMCLYMCTVFFHGRKSLKQRRSSLY